jgi:hypothetical protein
VVVPLAADTWMNGTSPKPNSARTFRNPRSICAGAFYVKRPGTEYEAPPHISLCPYHSHPCVSVSVYGWGGVREIVCRGEFVRVGGEVEVCVCM